MSLFLVDGLKPFSVLVGFIVLLLVFEIALMAVGLSSNVESDGASDGLDIEPSFGADVDQVGAFYESGSLTFDEVATLELRLKARQVHPPRPTLQSAYRDGLASVADRCWFG